MSFAGFFVKKQWTVVNGHLLIAEPMNMQQGVCAWPGSLLGMTAVRAQLLLTCQNFLGDNVIVCLDNQATTCG